MLIDCFKSSELYNGINLIFSGDHQRLYENPLPHIRRRSLETGNDIQTLIPIPIREILDLGLHH